MCHHLLREMHHVHQLVSKLLSEINQDSITQLVFVTRFYYKVYSNNMYFWFTLQLSIHQYMKNNHLPVNCGENVS